MGEKKSYLVYVLGGDQLTFLCTFSPDYISVLIMCGGLVKLSYLIHVIVE